MLCHLVCNNSTAQHPPEVCAARSCQRCSQFCAALARHCSISRGTRSVLLSLRPAVCHIYPQPRRRHQAFKNLAWRASPFLLRWNGYASLCLWIHTSTAASSTYVFVREEFYTRYTRRPFVRLTDVAPKRCAREAREHDQTSSTCMKRHENELRLRCA